MTDRGYKIPLMVALVVVELYDDGQLNIEEDITKKKRKEKPNVCPLPYSNRLI